MTVNELQRLRESLLDVVELTNEIEPPETEAERLLISMISGAAVRHHTMIIGEIRRRSKSA